MKKFVLYVLLAALMICNLSVGAQATSAEAATVSVGTVNAAPGQNVTVTVSIAGCDSIKSIMILPEWDESSLELTEAEWLLEKTALADWSMAEKNGVAAFSDSTDINGDIFRMSFKVKEDAASGLSAVGCEVVLKNGSVSIPATVVSGGVNISAASEYTPLSDFTYTTSGSELTITEYTGSAADVNIAPSYEVDGVEYTVTAITGYSEKVGKKTYYYGAFMDNTAVETVIIPETVTKIGDSNSEFYALYGCTALKSVTIYGTPAIAGATLGMFYDDKTESDKPVEGLTIHSWTGDAGHPSTAQIYAEASGIAFEGLEDVVLRGYQTTGTEGLTSADTYRIRFAAEVDSLTKYTSVGFDLEAVGHKSWTSNTNTVYKSLNGTTPDGKTITAVTANEGKYLFAISISGVPGGTEVVFNVNPYVVNRIGAKVYAGAHTITVSESGVVSQ